MKSKFLMGVMFLGAALARAEVQAAEEPKKTDKGVIHVNAKEAQKLAAEKQVVVLDVRTAAEFKEGHIAGATNVDFRATDFEKRIGQLDKSKTYLVHCAAGGRSTQSLPVLKKQELKAIYHLDGGFNSWKKEGLPIEK
jgi:rhodanese-related sulfurtransferase